VFADAVATVVFTGDALPLVLANAFAAAVRIGPSPNGLHASRFRDK